MATREPLPSSPPEAWEPLLRLSRLAIRPLERFIYSAGIHPTVAGVLIGFMTPVRARLGPDGFVEGVRKELDHLADAPPAELSSHELALTLRNVDAARREAMSPAESMIERLHPWVAFGIMPVFALANAGVSLSGLTLDGASRSVVTGAAVGLVVGKPLGVLAASWLALRLKIGTLPAGLSMRHLVVVGAVAGVGGLILGRALLSPAERKDIAQTADEAESSTEK